LVTGSSIVVDAGEYAHRHILFFGTLEEDTTDVLVRLARPGWTFIDIGANAGYFSLLAAGLGGPSSRVVAFEPNPALVAMLAESVSINAFDQVTVEAAACSESSGQAALALSPEPRNSGLSSLEPSVAATWSSARLPVPTVRLDEYCQERGLVPDVVKIDVEGHERSAVRGMTGLLGQHLPAAIVCELSGDPRRAGSAQVVGDLAAFGYEAFRIRAGGEVSPLEPGGALSEEHENVLFLSPQAAQSTSARGHRRRLQSRPA
jgi:FkbM family methyltransferase